MRVLIITLMLVSCVPAANTTKGSSSVSTTSSMQTSTSPSTLSEAKKMNETVISTAPEQKIAKEELGSLADNVQLSDEELALLQGQASHQNVNKGMLMKDSECFPRFFALLKRVINIFRRMRPFHISHTLRRSNRISSAFIHAVASSEHITFENFCDRYPVKKIRVHLFSNLHFAYISAMELVSCFAAFATFIGLQTFNA